LVFNLGSNFYSRNQTWRISPVSWTINPN